METLSDTIQLLKALVAGTSDASAVIRLALHTCADHYCLISGRCLFDQTVQGHVVERLYTYPELVLIERRLDATEALGFLESLIQAEKVDFPGLRSICKPNITANVRRFPSRTSTGWLPTEWPTVQVEFYGAQSTTVDRCLHDSGGYLVGANAPLYPSALTAISSFVHDRVVFDERPHFPLFLTFVEDRRARITGLHLQGSLLTVSTEQAHEVDCVVRAYGSTVPREIQERGVDIQEEQASIKLDSKPDQLLVGLVTRQGELLDERRIDIRYGFRPEELVVTPETLELTVEQWIEAGENEQIEFKLGLDTKEKRDDFLETVVAFANTRGGTIILGVADDTTPVGFSRPKFREDVVGMLRDKCDPLPTYSIEELRLSGVPLTLFRVEKSSKPCALDRDKFYIRAGGTDRRARHDDLMRLFRPTA